MTGQPAAKAAALSPPAVAKAKGKLLAENTPTGPSGSNMRRISGRGSGWRSGRAVSMTASTQEPSRKRAEKARNWPVVRAISPVRRASPSAVSPSAAAMSASARDSISSAAVSRKSASVVAGKRRVVEKASAAARTAPSISAAVAS